MFFRIVRHLAGSAEVELDSFDDYAAACRRFDEAVGILGSFVDASGSNYGSLCLERLPDGEVLKRYYVAQGAGCCSE